MSQAQFFTRLLITTVIALGCNVGLTYLFTDLRQQWPFVLGGIALFFMLTVIIYFSALPAARSENKARLAQYVMVLTFVKMMLSIVLVYSYYSFGKPPSRSFLYPFFVSYLCFTLFETIWLVQLAQSTSKPKHVS
jgi:hypothetical protein